MKVIEEMLTDKKVRKKGVMILYVSDYCEGCEEVKKYLKEIEEYARMNGYDFEVKNLNDIKSIDEAMKEGVEDIPIILVKNSDGSKAMISPSDVIIEMLRLKGMKPFEVGGEKSE